MNRDAAAVIGGAASVQTVADLRADEGIGVPCAGVRHRLHVVMRVQQHGRRVFGDDARANDLPGARGAVGIVGLHHLGVDADLPELVGHEFRGTPHMVRGDALRGNRLQCDLPVEHVDDAVEIRVDARADLLCA